MAMLTTPWLALANPTASRNKLLIAIEAVNHSRDLVASVLHAAAVAQLLTDTEFALHGPHYG